MDLQDLNIGKQLLPKSFCTDDTNEFFSLSFFQMLHAVVSQLNSSKTGTQLNDCTYIMTMSRSLVMKDMN